MKSLSRILQSLRWRFSNFAYDAREWLASLSPAPQDMHDPRPRVLLLADRRNWAFDHAARALSTALAAQFRLETRYVAERPRIKPEQYDLIHVFFWGETWQRQFCIDPCKIVKEVWSNRWRDDDRYGPCTATQLAQRYLRDAATVTVTSERMKQDLGDCHPRIRLTPNGVDPAVFHPTNKRHGKMTIGWAGNPDDPVKQFPLIQAASCDQFDLRVAGGGLKHEAMNDFYNTVDVFVIASRHEGDPLPLLEAMAAGCYPICTDVGVARELITDGDNGRIVEGNESALRNAFTWCAENIDHVRAIGQRNAHWMATNRRWSDVTSIWANTWNEAIAKTAIPTVRNDDVSWDTDLGYFEQFCALIRARGIRLIHGITLRGATSTRHRMANDPSEYPEQPAFVRLNNQRIRELSAQHRIEDRPDLVAYLNQESDELALHGLFHTDYRTMSAVEQRDDLNAGLALMDQLFPGKPVRYFIPPFNRINKQTKLICRELGLHILATESRHLEAELSTVVFEPRQMYRCHHHRFYPDSTFDYYRLDLTRLEAALSRTAAKF